MSIEVGVEPQRQGVAPGERGYFTVTVRNSGDAAVRAAVKVGPEVADWAWVSPPEVDVAAGGQAEARLSVRLPRPPDPAAGPLAFSVDIAGAVAAATIDVKPVIDVSASLGRSEGRNWGHPLTVRNKGNATVSVALQGGADGVRVDPSSVTVERGAVATASVHVRGKEGEQFHVHIRPDGGAASMVTGLIEKVAGAGGVRRLLKWPVVVPVVVVVLLAAALAFRGGGSTASSSSAAADRDVVGPTLPDDPSCPARNHLAADPAGLPPRQVPIPGRYSFLEVRQGGCLPVRFNPCEPIHYVVNSKLAPPGGLEDLTAAFAQVSAATGMTFVNDGPTDEPAALARPHLQPQRYGANRWAPLLVAWDHGGQFRMEDTNPGGGRSLNVGGVYVSGFLILNVDAKGVTPGFGDGATWGRAMIHELGHMVGLGHVRASTDIMFTELGLQRGRAEFHTGDLEGLKYLGKDAGCLTTPTPGPTR